MLFCASWIGICIKYLYDHSFVDAYTFLFYDGILCIIILFITIGFFSIYKGSDYFVENIKGVSLLFNDGEIIIYFFLLLYALFFII